MYSESDATGVLKLEISVVNTVSDVEIDVQKLGGKPTIIAETPHGEVYSYLNISVENAEDIDIKDAKITCKVDRSWIDDNNVDRSTIRLNRYHDGRWNPLPTQLTGEDDAYVYITAQTPGFSVFAITGEVIGATPTPTIPVAEMPTPTVTSTPPGWQLGFELVLIIFTIIALLIVIYLVFRRRED
ncbi:MAG: PGF-pre-PGF domain-containing protein [Deltaproteobacteria bacterium]|nr:PGF-pre-PGF domain-containing protein [Deltaproteobacteria bacterium]